ncbi:MAG TPA: hypothetical protein VH817_19360 [Thermoleophilaceae bacterium]|jgi:hypothetical protein
MPTDKRAAGDPAALAWQRETQALANDAALYQAEHDARLKVAQGAIGRSQTGAEAVRNTAAALGTLYTGVLGVAFAVDKDHPIPARGVIPAFFLGLALVFATAYVAFLWPGKETRSEKSRDATLRAQQEARLDTFTLWTGEIARRRAWALHTAVFSLGAAVATLPLPFVDWDGAGPWIAAGVLALAIALATGITGYLMQKSATAAARS